MINLIKKATYSNKELEDLDIYFDKHTEELFDLDNDTIVRFITTCEKDLGYCLSIISLEYYVCNIICDEKYDVKEEQLEYYEKLIDLVERLSFWDVGLIHAIGDYFYNKGDEEKAIKYYERVFKKGFDLSNIQYYNSLVKYYRLLKINPSEKLKELVDNSPNTSEFNVDSIDTYLLLIINLKKFSDEYLHYIFEGIKVATPVVRKIQEKNKGKGYWSDSEEERDLCELVALKLEYYVHNKEYVKAFEAYNELTDEIGRSDCTRYYHARDKYYRQLLDDLSATYPELKFFNNIGYYKFKVLNNVRYLFKDQIITLKKKDGLTFKFKVLYTNEDKSVVLIPILPLLGEGGRMLMDISHEDGVLYLTNSFSN